MRCHSFVLAAVSFLLTLTAYAEEIIELQTRQGVTQPYLLSFENNQKYPAVALLFVGSEGYVGLRERGIPKPGRNFLLRTRSLFLKNGIATAVVDSPSDMRGMTDVFRLSKEHANDVGAVVDDVNKRFPDAKIFLVGTSRGTISAASAGALRGERINGIVLTSTLFVAAKVGPGLSSFDFRSIKVPLLFVHHRQDDCRQTPYSSAHRLSSQFPLISVAGGDPPQSGPCEPFSNHGYLGREAQVIDAISAWMLGKPFPADVQ